MVSEATELAISPSRLRLYLQCPAKYHFKYSLNEKEEPTIPMQLGIWVHEALCQWEESDRSKKLPDILKELFVKPEYGLIDNAAFKRGLDMASAYVFSEPPRGKILLLEHQFNQYLPNGVPIRCILDRADEISPDQVQIIDYKTGGGNIPGKADLKHDVQGLIYSSIIRMMYPQYKRVTMTFLYLNDNVPVSIDYSNEELDSFQEWLAVIYQRILNDTTHKAIVNDFCNTCSWNHRCSSFMALAKDINSLPVLSALDLPDNPELIAQKLSELKRRLRIAEEVREQMENYLLTLLTKQEVRELELGDQSVRIVQKKYLTYDWDVVAKHIQADQMKHVASLSREKIDNFLAGEPVALEEIQRTAATNYGKAYVAVKDLSMKPKKGANKI
jgi:hypothetical protein